MACNAVVIGKVDVIFDGKGEGEEHQKHVPAIMECVGDVKLNSEG